MAFTYEKFVAEVRDAVRSDPSGHAVAQLLRDTVADPGAVAAAIPPQDRDEVHLFEDENVSIWSCRFQPTHVIPPHEHKMPVWIAVFSGSERNIFYRRDARGLHEAGARTVAAGEVLAIGDDAIHAVTAEGSVPSHALHVYLGPLTRVKRDLFNPDSGAPVAFTDEHFERLTQRKPSAEA